MVRIIRIRACKVSSADTTLSSDVNMLGRAKVNFIPPVYSYFLIFLDMKFITKIGLRFGANQKPVLKMIREI